MKTKLLIPSVLAALHVCAPLKTQATVIYQDSLNLASGVSLDGTTTGGQTWATYSPNGTVGANLFLGNGVNGVTTNNAGLNQGGFINAVLPLSVGSTTTVSVNVQNLGTPTDNYTAFGICLYSSLAPGNADNRVVEFSISSSSGGDITAKVFTDDSTSVASYNFGWNWTGANPTTIKTISFTLDSATGLTSFSINGNLNPFMFGDAQTTALSGARIGEIVGVGFYEKNFNIAPTTYSDFLVTQSIPEPSAVALVVGGLGLVAAWKRQRRSTPDRA